MSLETPILGSPAAEYKIPAKYSGYIITTNPQLVSAETVFKITYDELSK